MQRKSEIYEQQQSEQSDDIPPLPIPVSPVITASLSVRDRVMRSIKAALEHDDHSQLSLLRDDETQLAVDTVWEVKLHCPVSGFPELIRLCRCYRCLRRHDLPPRIHLRLIV